MLSQVDGNLRTFAERLRALMDARGINRSQLVLATGIESRLIAKYRAGKVEPRDYWGRATPNAVKLAAALGVSINDLLPPREEQAA